MDGIESGMTHRMKVIDATELVEIYNLIKSSEIAVSFVERVQNWNLYQRYQLMKINVTQIVAKHRPGTVVEKRLFHGTKREFTDSICREGFNRDYSRKSHGMYIITPMAINELAIVSMNYCYCKC